MKPEIHFTTEAQRAQSNDPSAPATALASPACGWSRLKENNPRVVVPGIWTYLGQSADKKSGLVFRAPCDLSWLKSFRTLRVLRAFVVSILALTAALHAQTNTFPASGNVGIGATTPDAKLRVEGPAFIYGEGNGLLIDTTAAANARVGLMKYGGYEGMYVAGSSTKLRLAHRTDSEYVYGGIPALREDFVVVGNGNVGIGTTTPNAKLSISPGSINLQSINFFDSNYGLGMDSSDLVFWTNAGQGITFKDNANSGYNGNPIMRIKGNGNVGIGTTNPAYPLTVNGAVRAKEVIVDTGWSDFVFDEGYRLASLSEVEAKIKSEHHLPGIPSAREVSEKGISVGEAQAKLLQKVEELTLYMIDLKKENEALKAKSATLEVRLEAIETKSP